MKNFKHKGQGLVEFALILPVLLLLLVGIAEGAHIIQAYLAAQAAVREAARYAVAGQPLNDDGDPWTETDPIIRAAIIKNLAIAHSRGTGYSKAVTDTVEYLTYLDPNCDESCAGVVAVRVGLDGEFPDWDNPGWEGENVRVELYHNVAIFDPIFAVIVPHGFLRIQTQIVMRNEGGPPLSGATPTPAGGGGGGSGSGGSGGASKNPAIEVAEGNPQPAGTSINLRVKNHPAGTYNIYVADVFIGVVSPGGPGVAAISYVIPLDTPAGSYTIESRKTDGVTQVAQNTLTVIQSTVPAILTGGDVWPFNSLLEYSLVAHPPDSPFDIELTDGSDTIPLSPLSTDAEGASIGSATYLIPDSLTEGMWTIQSISSTVVATRALSLREGCIKINQGDCAEVISAPNGVYIYILLEKHAYNRDYIVTFSGDPLNPLNVTTDDEGKAYLIYTIPLNTPNGTYTISSEDAANPGPIIAQTEVEVDTPAGPFIHVDGGYTWPAGSNILFQLRQHSPNEYYDIYWEDSRVISQSAAISGSLNTDDNGMLWLDFDIPVDAQGTYHLQSHLHSPNPVTGVYSATSNDITVTPSAYLKITEGTPQIPGASVNVELHNHAINTRYDVYVNEGLSLCDAGDAAGRILPDSHVTTNINGNGDIPYDIPSDIQGKVHIRSYLKGSADKPAASFCLDLVAADLQVLSIETPDPPVFNKEMPITVTIINAAPVTITHRSFDVDIYLDPPTEPNLGRSLPPGDFKIWMQPPMAYSETRTFTAPMGLYGAFDHRIWARADTSNRIAETIEDNNLLSTLVSPATCEIEYTSAVSWSVQTYGDTDLTAPNTEPRLRMVSSGSGTWPLNDNNDGFLFGYRSISGNFEAQVRLSGPKSNATKWGIEIRGGPGNTDPKLDWGYYRGWGNLQAQNRKSDGSRQNTSDAQFLVNHPSETPIWVRVVRDGSDFDLYYADDAGGGSHGAWNPAVSYTNNMGSGALLVGLFASAYNSNLRTFDFNYFRICIANSDCSTGNVIYEVNYDGVMDAGWASIPFGDADSPTPSFIEEAPPDPPPPFDVSGDVITMFNNGSSTWQSDDADGGFLLGYHQISGNFDARVRAVQQDDYEDGSSLNQWAKFGLEVRAGTDSGDDKLDWVATHSHGLQYLHRESGSQVAKKNDINTGPFTPVWLRIARDGEDFTLYYSYETNDPPSEWEFQETLNAPNMPETIHLGLINASYNSSKKNMVVFEGYHVCANPGGAASCGEVREAGGMAVINATNYINSHPDWGAVSRGGKSGLSLSDDGNTYSDPDTAPGIEYAVDFSNVNQNYYIWLLASRPNSNGNSVYIGLNGSNYATMTSNKSNNTLAWFNTPVSSLFIDSLGSNSISVRAHEDGFELYQILLTNDPNFDPETDVANPLNIPQSQCSAAGQPAIPPGMLTCETAVVNGNFEDDALMSKWVYQGVAQGVTRTSMPHYYASGESFSMLLPAKTLSGLPRQPWLYQEIKMPGWVLTPTLGGGTSINLSAHVAVNPDGASNPGSPEPLYALLRDQAGQPLDSYAASPTGAVTFTTDAQLPTMDPNNPDPGNSEWLEKTVDLAQYFNPPASLLAYKGQTMRLFFESPNPTYAYSTIFYLDNVDLEICTMQPIPTSFDTKVAGTALVFIDGVPTEKPGTKVWIYAIDGSMAKTYTIQDSTFSFYDLPADDGGVQYILYAEYLENDVYYIASTIIVLHTGQAIDNISLLLLN